MAIPMPIQQDIRRYDRQEMSHVRIARELGVDRGTVAKYAKLEDCSLRPKKDRRCGRKTDAFERVIDAWLQADREVSDGFYACVGIGGVMQVDFGVALADVAGSEQTIHFLVATLPYSNMR